MSRIQIAVLACVGGLVLQSLCWAEQRPPNVVIMMADDMGLGDTSAYQDWTGNSNEVQVKTPSMERMARMGIRFTDAHSPSSRCTATRQALLTGRYTWRTRLKYSVIWGPQGPPLIEKERPTIATLLWSKGYRCGMSGKWHCGLTYRNRAGEPESNYENVDLTQGIADGPLNHGFDFFHGTSRSHPTSAPQGWLFGDRVPAATGGLEVDRSKYVLNQTGPKNFDMAIKFMHEHVIHPEHKAKPFFLYYACHSNHTSHNPSRQINGIPVKGKSHPGGKRSDFIYENDVALGQLIEFLEATDDPREPGSMLIDNTLIIFTSDNGAENNKKSATGPIRSNKASMYEGGHRVPFIATWRTGGIGDGEHLTPGQTSDFPVCHVDLYATLAEIVDLSAGDNEAEDSFSILDALRGDSPASRTPIIHNDHKEGAPPRKSNNPLAAWMAIRVDDPVVDERVVPGQWKLLVDHNLLINGWTNAKELYDLRTDLKEERNRIAEPELAALVAQLTEQIQTIHDSGRIDP